MQDKEPEEFRENSTLLNFWQTFRCDRIALLSFYAFVFCILAAVFAPLIAPYSPDMQFVGNELTPPSWFAKGQVSYFLGTDNIGRDLLSRLISGFRYTFLPALLVVLFISIVGGVLGIIVGIGRGIQSSFLGHFFDAFLSVPILLIAIVIATLMQPSLFNAVLAISLALLPHFIHQIYQAIQQELQKDYVMLLRLDGATSGTLLKETILPNIVILYIKEVSRVFTLALLDISALSFISLGAQSPTPEWGAMISDYLSLVYLAPWAVFLPGLFIIVTILIVLILSNGLCRAIEKHYE